MDIDRDQYVTPSEVALQLGVSREAVRQWIIKGQIPALRLPGPRGRYLIRRDAVQLQAAGGNPDTTVIDSEK